MIKPFYIKMIWGILALLLFASCNRVVLVVDDVPGNTPLGDPIYLAGNFNMWSPGEERYELRLDQDSNYYFSLPAGFGEVEYKFTRGNWATVEKGICGEEIVDRTIVVNDGDTVYHSIESWGDLNPINCPRCVLLIDMLPSNTPKNDIIAIASDLNSWNPNEASIARRTANGQLYVEIERPEGVNSMEYKITRGDLSNSEADEYGQEIPNRLLKFGESDTLVVTVDSWVDLPLSSPDRVTIIIKNLPKLTPKNEPIYLASKLNSWTAGDRSCQFQKNRKGQLYYSFPRMKMYLDYKITRDGWYTVEVDRNGYDIDNRQINLEFADTIYIDVQRWKDQEDIGSNTITLVLDKIPESTPVGANIYIAGAFNNWNPGRLRYMFKQDEDGKYYVNIARKRGDFEFKITRGSWESIALDEYGAELPTYGFNYSDFDTLIIKPEIKNWKDLPILSGNRVVKIILNSVPDNTEEGEKIYLASDKNGWDPEDKNQVFEPQEDGKYYITVPYQGESMSYKITKGGWGKVEKDSSGNDIENRVLNFGFSNEVRIDVASWGW
ncbi:MULTISPECIES: hypothetical protein [unclassified Lentimicrobium]|uniref:hypothetical protein n=1 Tax=unclassified Lentimicrobium TaxID=2677434 RepID=UPI0015547E75|nr:MULTISPECIES: hypothetical protein [unclassified Lentimicrobium]NPD47659.1 hypothetical protein [Lentimicrobium sp. S6]NPD86613.1 hypothetical protein [Lentimicrobium sp. L6]